MSAPERLLLVDVADGFEPIKADEAAVKLFSSCAQGLPEHASTWPIGSLQCDGRPFNRDTVVGWMNLVYNHVHGHPFDSAGAFSSSIWTALQGGSPSVTAEQLHKLLAFAHAVGSPAGLIQAALAHSSNLKVVAAVGRANIEFSMAGIAYELVGYIDRPGSTLKLTASAGVAPMVTLDAADAQSLRNQAASQLEQLLYIASVLQLKPLTDKVYTFYCVNTSRKRTGSAYQDYWHSILPDNAAEIIFSDRVAAANCDDGTNKQAWISSKLQMHCSFVPGKAPFVLEPVSPQPQSTTFKTVLRSDFMGTKAGEEVDVTLDLMGASTMSVTHRAVGTRTFAVTLCIGAGQQPHQQL